jgi:hypothetical protein
MILGHAIERYGFKKQPCLVCGVSKRVHAHHKDYSKPLDVDWYCPKHHKEIHANS